MYTVGERGAQYPSGFVRAQQKAGVIPTQCNLASVAPAAAVQGVLVLTSTSISTLQNAKTTEQASSTIANPVVQTATSTSLPTLQDTKTTDQASKTTAKPIKQTTSSTVTPPSQSSSLIPSAVVSPLTTAITTLPMSAESASSISQTMNSLPTPQQSPWPSVDTAVQTKSPTVPQTTITAPDSLLQSSKPSSRASTEITSAQTSPTANTVPAVLDTETGRWRLYYEWTWWLDDFDFNIKLDIDISPFAWSNVNFDIGFVVESNIEHSIKSYIIFIVNPYVNYYSKSSAHTEFDRRWAKD
ncbi:hypothetical protein Vi05172_g9930 [Venturia inaequalis]|nr:hypothetical protein Vi05172_g9930 [Venturia inaequalis]